MKDFCWRGLKKINVDLIMLFCVMGYFILLEIEKERVKIC